MAGPLLASALATVGEARRFGSLLIGASKVVLQSPCGLAVAYGDVRPILPGHCIVAPTRSQEVQRLHDLTEEELDALFATVHRVQQQLGPHHRATAFNLAVHDGAIAGQPSLLPHAHVHVVPRVAGDLESNDEVYELVQRWSPEGAETVPPPFYIPSDDERKPRTEEQMANEARRYAAAAGSPPPAASEVFQFGRIRLASTQLFYSSDSTVATVNLKPLCPGHVLVVPKRNVRVARRAARGRARQPSPPPSPNPSSSLPSPFQVPLLAELPEGERVDLWRSVRVVQEAVCRVHGAAGCKIGVQDGRDAGQSVPHVHVHVLPQGHEKDKEP